MQAPPEDVDPFDTDFAPDDPPGQEAPPFWFPGEHLDGDARRLGLTHHVPEGALLDLAGSLDSTKAVHRFAAWVMLVVFGLPVVFAVMRIFYALG